MNRFLKTSFILLWGVCTVSGVFSVEKTTVAKIIHKAEIGFHQRWNDFVENQREFPLWISGMKEQDLRARFDKMVKDRWSVYFVNPEDFDKEGVFGRWKEEYRMPENWELWFSRYPYPIAPAYTFASPNYNASIISLQGMHFLALEAPCKKNLKAFFEVLNEYCITDLVRLTPAIYKGRQGSFPYWEGRMNIHSDSGRPSIEVSDREINYFPTDCWEDHQGIAPEKLLALIKAVKNSVTSDSKMIAVHCRAGVGRTGAFIAGYLLINEIDQQIADGIDVNDLKMSIDKVIWQLSLQRPFTVTHFPQYLMLYDLMDHYTELLKRKGPPLATS